MKILSVIIFSLTAIVFQCCEVDKNDIVINHDCPEGYSGPSCETAWRTKMLGDYSVQQNCSFGNFGPFYFTITADDSNPLKLNVDGIEGSTPVHFDWIMRDETSFEILSRSGCIGCFDMIGGGTINTTTQTISLNYSFSNRSKCEYTFSSVE